MSVTSTHCLSLPVWKGHCQYPTVTVRPRQSPLVTVSLYSHCQSLAVLTILEWSLSVSRRLYQFRVAIFSL